MTFKRRLIPYSVPQFGSEAVGLSSESAVGFSLTYLLVFNVFTAIMGAFVWFISPVGRNFLEALGKGKYR